eukprot:TCALIF_12637-PA protein Name:"Similar to kdrl Vascular endothelial growth factor receptor kdr-like (Danio rerio)" AED:0.19 eAED:0.19 QI:50/0.85/1/1/0.42/0.5/8/39/535
MLTAFLYQRNKMKEESITEAEVAQFRFGDPKSINPELPIEEQTDLLPYDDDIEFPKDRLKLGQQIGCGAFGRVVQAVAYGIDRQEAVSTVAVKMVKPPVTKSHLVGLMSEIKIMLHIGKHLNVVNILGAVTKDLVKRELLVIVEYCCHGSLQQFLLKHRKTFVNQVNPLTGIFDPNKVHKTPRFRKRTLDSKRSSDVNYATLEIHDNTKTLDDEDDKISPLPLRQKKVSNVSRHSFDDTCFTSDSPNIKERRPKVSIISTDSEFDNIGNTTDMTCVSGVSPRNRIHKISIQSTDSEFDHIENATDMTILSNRQQNLIQDEFSQPKETRESIATKHYLILNKPFEEENELRQTKYVYLQHIPTKADSKSDEGPSETCPMLPQPSLTIPREPEMSTPIDQGFAFFNPTYSQIKKPHPASRPIIGQKRQASSRSLLACKVSESDGIQPFHSQNHLNLSKYAKVDLTPTAEVELQIVQHHSSSSLSSGFHSNSSDVLKSSLHKRHLDRPHAEKRRDIDPKLDLLDKPVASFNGAANMIN